MKKFALLLILPLVLSVVTVAAQKKEGSTESATTEQHVVLNPADLKWGDVPPGLPPGAKMAVLAGDPTKKDRLPCGCRHLPVTKSRHTLIRQRKI